MKQGLIRCDLCVYWWSKDESNLGECHRQPPAINEINGWPVVGKAEWCGEFSSGLAEIMEQPPTSNPSPRQSVQEHDSWREEAERQSRNVDYYRSIVVRIGELFGREARITDSGEVVPDVLCAKVYELVKRLAQQPMDKASPDSTPPCRHVFPEIGCSKCMDLTAHATGLNEYEVRPTSCHHVYPEIGCSKCVGLVIDDTGLRLQPKDNYKEPVKNCVCGGKGCRDCNPKKLDDPCFCGGRGCNSCEPQGRG